MKQVHKVRFQLSRGLLGLLVGNCLPRNPAFYLLLPTDLLFFVLILLPKRLLLLSAHSRCGQDGPSLFSAPQTSQCMWLMQALGFLLSALQVEEILKNLHSLISPYIQQLEKLAEEIVSELRGPGAALAFRAFSAGVAVGMLELALGSAIE